MQEEYRTIGDPEAVYGCCGDRVAKHDERLVFQRLLSSVEPLKDLVETVCRSIMYMMSNEMIWMQFMDDDEKGSQRLMQGKLLLK